MNEAVLLFGLHCVCAKSTPIIFHAFNIQSTNEPIRNPTVAHAMTYQSAQIICATFESYRIANVG